MARRTAVITITRDGRDAGGVFDLREMPVMQETEWFIRAMQILARSGADVPPNIMHQGIAGFVTMGIGTVLTGLGKSPWHEVKPLLDELLTCVVSYQPPGGSVPLTGWNVIKTQIEEASTIMQLYEEVVSLGLGFSLAERLSNYRTLATTMMAALTPTMPTSIETSPSSSDLASPA